MRGAGILMLWLAVGLAGCAGGGGNRAEREAGQINQWLSGQELHMPLLEYRVQPPDVLLIQAPNIAELDGHEQAVRPDGKISLNLLGEIDVAGRTPAEISRLLSQIARQYYDPEMVRISVQVTEFRSKMIYVFGQVDFPGIKPYTGRDTLLNVLAEARLNDRSWPERVVLVRPSDQEDVRQRVTVDLKHMYQSGELSQNYVLEEGDVIYVPPHPLVAVNTTFNQLLFPLRPLTRLLTLGGG